MNNRKLAQIHYERNRRIRIAWWTFVAAYWLVLTMAAFLTLLVASILLPGEKGLIP